MRESTTQPKNPRLPINKPHRPIARRGFSDSVTDEHDYKKKGGWPWPDQCSNSSNWSSRGPGIPCRGRGRREAKKKVLRVKHWSHCQRCDCVRASSEEACLPCWPPPGATPGVVGMWAGMLRQCRRKKASLIGKGRLSLSSRSPSLHLNPMCLEEEGAIVTYWFAVLRWRPGMPGSDPSAVSCVLCWIGV